MNVFGIDPSTRRISLAVVDHTDRPPYVTTIETGEGLSLLRRRLIPWLAMLPDPACVFIEQPFAQARRVPPVSYEVIGVVKEAVLTTFGIPANDITVSDWKKRSVGHGNATKPDVLRWAQQHGYGGYCPKCELLADCKGGLVHDEADAIGIAVAGWDLTGQELQAA